LKDPNANQFCQKAMQNSAEMSKFSGNEQILRLGPKILKHVKK